MRSPGAVYRKLKEVKYRYLVALYRQFLRPIPENCIHNHRYVFRGEDGKEYSIRLCMLHQDQTDKVVPHLIDVCQETGHSCKCNAFVNQHTKESVKEMLEDELKDQDIRAKKYPEICALEWVLERSVVGIPPFTWFQVLFFKLKHWILKNRIL